MQWETIVATAIIGALAKIILERVISSLEKRVKPAQAIAVARDVVKRLSRMYLIAPVIDLAGLLVVMIVASRAFPAAAPLMGSDVTNLLALSGFLSFVIFGLLTDMDRVRRHREQVDK